MGVNVSIVTMTIWQPNIDTESGPRYVAIANAIESDVNEGRLPPGTKLPTHRDLADRLGVTVGTVTRGYAEAARRGLLRGETGRGTFVGGEQQQSLMFHHEDVESGVVDMNLTLPFEQLSPRLDEALKAVAADPNVQQLLQYYPSAGRRVDREAGVQWVKRYNLTASAEQISLTVGGQNALAVVLSSMFRPGDAIAVEGITYPLIKTLARRFHLKLIPVEQDAEGMVPESLEHVCRTHGVRGVYLMPTCQNPTNSRMPEYRRQEIAAMAQRHDLSIIEDDAYALLSDTLSIPFAALAPERTFFIASMSKSMAGGLRVAYLVSPLLHAKAVERALSDMVWMTPPLLAEIARRWINDGTAERTLAVKRAEALKRVGIVKEIFSGLDFSVQKTGYYVWLKLPEPWTSADFANIAKENGVLVAQDDKFAVGRTPLPHAVRIALSSASDTVALRKGLEVLRHIITD